MCYMNKQNIYRLPKGLLYITLSFLLWLIVEYGTVWHSRLNEWLSLMPYILIQQLVIILFFYYLIFRKKLAEKKVFIAMLIVMFIFEFLWKNFLLYNPVWLVPGVFLLISIWGFLTFIPLWIVNKSIKKHKLQVICCLLWIPVGFILSLLMR